MHNYDKDDNDDDVYGNDYGDGDSGDDQSNGNDNDADTLILTHR